jgi:formylglycine-generating enzyme required for sulfatase activity
MRDRWGLYRRKRRTGVGRLPGHGRFLEPGPEILSLGRRRAANGNGRTYPWGEGIDCNRTRYDGEGCSGSAILPVGSLPAGASPYGALDMAGNVAEWVAEAVVRGGNPYSFRANTVNTPEALRADRRAQYYSDLGTPMLGFRCVLSP